MCSCTLQRYIASIFYAHIDIWQDVRDRSGSIPYLIEKYTHAVPEARHELIRFLASDPYWIHAMLVDCPAVDLRLVT